MTLNKDQILLDIVLFLVDTSSSGITSRSLQDYKLKSTASGISMSLNYKSLGFSIPKNRHLIVEKRSDSIFDIRLNLLDDKQDELLTRLKTSAEFTDAEKLLLSIAVDNEYIKERLPKDLIKKTLDVI